MQASRKPTFRVLGHLEVGNGQAPALGGRKQRALLAYLLLHAGKPVSTGTLVDAVWGGDAPPTAAAIVYAYVRKLRVVLDGLPASLEKDAAGYRLAVADDEIDLRLFESLAKRGKEALGAGDASAAAQLLGEAAALWRGEPLVELDGDETADAARRRLEQERLDASLDRIDAELALGRHEQVVPALRQLVVEHPYEERVRARLMLALYRSGRQADALEAYRAARATLSGDLGLEPSSELRELEQAILRQDPALAPPPASAPEAGPEQRPRRRRALVAAAVLVIAAAAAAAVAIFGSSGRSVAVKLNSVAVLDPRSAAVVADVAVGRDPVRVVTGDGATWTINEADQTLSRIDPRTLRTQAIGLPGSPSGLAAADGTVVVGDGEAGSVSLIDPRTDSTQAVPLGSEQDERGTVLRFVAAVAPAGRDVWTVAGGHPPRLMRIEASGTARMHEATGLLAPDGPNGFAVSGGAAWSLAPGALTRVDLQRHVATQIPIGPAGSDTNFGGSQLPTGLATGAGGVWATNPYAALLEEVSPQTGAQLVAVRVPGRPTAVAIDGGTAWVVGFDGEVSALDVATGTVRKTVRLGHAATGVAAGYGRVWVTISGA